MDISHQQRSTILPLSHSLVEAEKDDIQKIPCQAESKKVVLPVLSFLTLNQQVLCWENMLPIRELQALVVLLVSDYFYSGLNLGSVVCAGRFLISKISGTARFSFQHNDEIDV